jgi:hypothetical protein
MKNVATWLVYVFLLGGLSVFLLSALYRYPSAPFGLHEWLPMPIACGGYSCITYRDLTIAKNNDSTNRSTEVILSAMMLDRVYRTVANFEKIRISEKEIDQARNAVTTTLKAIPGGENVMNEVYGKEAEKMLTGNDFTFLLLKEKLSALGVEDPWKSKYAPKITVWNWWIKWDDGRKQFVLR